MLDLSSQVEIDTESLIMYIVDSIPGAPSTKSFLYESKTLNSLKEKLKTYELIQSKYESKQNTQRSLDIKKRETNSVKKLHCFNCGDTKHTVQDCPDKECNADQHVKC